MAQSSEIEKLERRWADNPLGLTFAPLAEAYRRAGEHPRALEVLEIGLARHEAYVPALIVRARCHLDAGLDAAAEESFRGVLATDAHNLIALKGLADICERGGRLEETRGHLDRLLEADPTHDDARTQYARVALVAETQSAVETDSTPAAAASLAAPEIVAEAASGIVIEEIVSSLQDWVAPEFELPQQSESKARGGEGAVATPPEPAEAERSQDERAEASSALEPQGPAVGGESDLIIEREISPFEGFDPGTWDLPFGDATPPDRPFEESSPLAPISLEQSYEAASLAEDAGAPAGEPAPWNDLDIERSAGSGIEAGFPAALSTAGAEESVSEVADPVAQVHESAWEVGTVEETHEPTAMREGPVHTVDDRSEPVVAPLGPLDIPDFIAWEGESAPYDASGAQPDTGVSQPALPEPGSVGIPEQVAEAPAPEPGLASDLDSWPMVGGAEWASVEALDSHLRPLPMEAVEETAPAAELPPAEGLIAEDVREPVAAPPAWDGPNETLDLAAAAEDAVVVVEGALEETPVDVEPEAAAVEPELVITETMAEVFLRQGHKPLALAVYAQLLERDAGNSRLVDAVARLRAELLPSTRDAASPVPDGSGPEEPVGAFLARVLGPNEAGSDGAAAFPEEPPGARPTQPSTDPTLDLSTIFGEEAPRTPRGRPAAAAPRGEGEPSFDEFFGGTGGGAGVAAGAGGEEEDLEQFNAWLRSLSR